MDEKEFILAIDIGGTSVKIGVVYQDNVVEYEVVRNVFKGDYTLLINGIKDICNKYIKQYFIHKIGIGCPGDICNGVVLFASNLGWKNYDILNDFKNNFPDCEVYVENDGNAACNAEMQYGYLKNVQDGIFICIGRGIGGMVISNGVPIRGAYQFGGKFGHTVIRVNGRKCNCGRKGCFETYCSVLGLIQNVREANIKETDETLKINPLRISGFQIVQYMQQGNSMVKNAVKKWNDDMAEGILNLCNIFDPKIIVIAGGITESGLIDIENLKDKAKNNFFSNVEIKLAKFKSKTGLIGAASLVK